jgi:acyl carrier protein
MQVEFEQIKELIIDNIPGTSGKEHLITPECSLTNDLGADSLDAVELILAVEEKFGLEVPDSVAENVKTVGDLMTYLESVK